MRPDFRKKEIVVEKPDEDNVVFGGGNTKETIGVVKYKGAEATKYEVGDKILFDMSVARLEINSFDKPLLRIETEDYVICRILEDE